VGAALYILGSVLATLAFLGFCVLLAQAFTAMFGIYGIVIASSRRCCCSAPRRRRWTGWLVY
jgi:hypothetical protein